jgi:crotonobetainyl-CoA:carnitine CoA-transferase CaiB-like acyl-CoA transferase
VKPDIVYCNTYAYGREGPLSHFGGLDPLYQASAGLEHEAGAVPHGHDPLYYRFGMCDAANAMLSVVAVLTALYHRRRTGEGQEVWTSLMDGGAMFASDVLLHADGTPSFRPKLDPAQLGFGPGYRLYETQDGWLQVAAVNEREWAALCGVLGVDPAADRTTVEPELEAVLATRTSVTWSYLLDDAGVPNEVPLDAGANGTAMLFDADNERLGIVTEYEHPIMGAMRQFGDLVTFSDTPGRILGPPPRVGEHTREILTWLGYDDARQEELKAAGVVYWPDADYPWSW